MKVIDLLNKIANKEKIPTKIKVYEKIYTLDKDSLNYMDNDTDWLAYIDGDELATYEVETIEEDKKIENKIEKLDCDIDFDDNVSINGKCLYDNALLEIGNKINEIIDYLNNKENK